MVQAGVAPFLVALLLAAGLAAWRREVLPWLALAAGVLTAVALSTGISFSPLTASRKIVLLVLLAPVLGLVLEAVKTAPRVLPAVLSVAAGLAAVWVFQSVIAQREGLQAGLLGGGLALFAAVLTAAVLRLRGDGVATGAAALALGAAVGVAAILSASLGNLINGVALAAAGAALLLLQLLRGSALRSGYVGTLTLALAAALFGAAPVVLAEGRWFTLVLLLAVPVVAGLPLFADGAPRRRTVLLPLVSLVAAGVAIAGAWLATRLQ